MRDTNRQLLHTAARLLRPLLEELVFVGGCVTGLLITDEAAPGVRATIDVDAIAEITSYSEYARFGERLRSVGFMEDSSEGAPLCRWRNGEVILDVMPLGEEILGFSNRWYKEAMHAAEVARLDPSLQIRHMKTLAENFEYGAFSVTSTARRKTVCDMVSDRDSENPMQAVSFGTVRGS